MGILDGEEVSRCGLTGPALGVVEALLSAPIAWRSPTHLAADSGIDPTAVFCALSDLESEGWICHWETANELTVTLTPIGAARLGVRLIESGPDELPRWVTPETPEPSPPKAKGIFREYSALACVISTDLGPDAAAEVLEANELDSDHPAGPRCLVRQPGLLLGSSAPWSGPRLGIDGPCPFCASKVRPGAYCLFCDGINADPIGRLKRDRKREARRSAVARSDRKARRRARFS